MSLKDYALGIVGVLAVVALVLVLNPTKIERPPLGSASSPSVIDGCMEINGVMKCWQQQAMRAATTTVCAFNIGKYGTSTLLFASVAQDLASTSIVTLAKANTEFATTTIVFEESVTANTQPVTVVLATSTGSANAAKYTFGAGVGADWLVVGIAAGATTLDGPDGVCQAEWILHR